MKLTDKNFNNHSLPQNQTFKADMMYGPFPGMIIPQEVPEDQYEHETNKVELPDLYYMPESYHREQTFVDKVKKVDMMGLIHPWFEHTLLMVASCTGLALGIDAFDKSCNKEFEKSILGKAAKLGDKIAESKPLNNKFSMKVGGALSKSWKWIKTKAMKNDVINAMVKTPSQPEWSTPKYELKHTSFQIVNRFKELANVFGLNPGMVVEDGKGIKALKIKNLALSEAETEGLKKVFKVGNLSEVADSEVVNRVILQRLGKTETEIASLLTGGNTTETVMKELVKKSGLTASEIETIFKDEIGTKETIELVKKASKNLKDIKIYNGKIVLNGKFQPFANLEGFQTVYNRANSITESGAKTRLGRFMGKMVQKLHKGLTFENKKLGVMLWVAPFITATILNTMKAEKDEKVGTAVAGMTGAVSWVFAFPFAIRAVHALGGIQYAGMGEEKVKAYRGLIEKFNKDVKEGVFGSWKEYLKAKHDLKVELRNMRIVPKQNFLTKILRGISKFTKADLLKLESYQGSSRIANMIRKLPNLLKDGAYAPLRFLVVMMAGVPIADKIINKITSAIFGKPYDDMKDTEMESAKEKQEEFTMNDLRSKLLEIQANKMNPQLENAAANINPKPVAEQAKAIPVSMTELAEKADKTEVKPMVQEIKIEEPAEEVPAVPEKVDNYTYIPSSENVLKNSAASAEKYEQYIPSPKSVFNDFNPTMDVNKYIPAQTGIKINKVFDNSGLEAALKRANNAEQKALNVLAGNFGNVA